MAVVAVRNVEEKTRQQAGQKEKETRGRSGEKQGTKDVH